MPKAVRVEKWGCDPHQVTILDPGTPENRGTTRLCVSQTTDGKVMLFSMGPNRKQLVSLFVSKEEFKEFINDCNFFVLEKWDEDFITDKE